MGTLVRMVRLELTRLATTASKTVAATSYATSALFWLLDLGSNQGQLD